MVALATLRRHDRACIMGDSHRLDAGLEYGPNCSAAAGRRRDFADGSRTQRRSDRGAAPVSAYPGCRGGSVHCRAERARRYRKRGASATSSAPAVFLLWRSRQPCCVCAWRCPPGWNPSKFQRLPRTGRPRDVPSTAIDGEERALLDRLRREAAFARRLDRLSRRVQRLERNTGIAIEALALFVRFWLTITPPLSADAQAAAQVKGRQRYEGFVQALGRRLQKGQSLLHEIPEDVDRQDSRVGDEPDSEPINSVLAVPRSAKSDK